MMTQRRGSTTLVLMIALSMVLVPMTAMASHNSVGANVYFAQADEVDADGELLADIPAESPYAEAYHENLEVPRLAPPDQTGDRYTDCVHADDVTGSYAQALRDGDACYVGFLDHQWEYFLWWNRLLFPKQSSDDLYQVNPEAGDDYCRGEGDPVLRVQRALDDPECSGEGHTWFVPGDVAVDTNLLETMMESGAAGAPGVAQLSGTDVGSGVLTFPLETTPYVFLFGQPHPDNPNPSEFEAGSGPFGPNPADGGSPLFDLTDACGERTQDCVLLTPKDLLMYDENTDGLGDVDGFGDQARLCVYRPQFVTVNPDDRDAGLCGVFGSVVNSFFPNTEEGGFDVPGVPSTWVQPQPGWFEAALIYPSSIFVPGVGILPAGEVGTVVDVADEPISDGEITDALDNFVAVNPLVPNQSHPLWCLRPNLLSVGQDVGEVNDPGLYGPYIADAIDTDAFVTSALLSTYEGAIDTVHPVTKPLYDSVIGVTEGATDDLNDLLDEAEVPEDVQAAIDEAGDRTNYLESSAPPQVTSPFTITQDKGIACDAQGVVQVFEETREIDGGVAMDVNVFSAGTGFELKDPTLLTDELPAGESETTQGAWQADQYSFDGSIFGFLDTSEDADEEPGAQFDGCASANGQPQPNNDFCTWQPLWDAYNPECTNLQGDATCGEILDGRGYDLDAGVGAYFVLKVSGPVVVTDEDLARPNEIESRSDVLGLNDPTGQNCIVGFSVGFQETDAVDAGDILAEACPGHTEGDGATLVIEDAFNDQSATSSLGGFSAAIQWTKLTPTPRDVTEAIDLGQGDELCVTTVWNVQAGHVADDTQGSLDLAGSGNPHTWDQCFPFEAAIQA